MKSSTVVDPLNQRSKNISFKRMLPVLAATALLEGSAVAQTLLWANNFNGVTVSALEEVEGVLADDSGNVFVTGLSGSKTVASGIRTMKLDANGNVLWNVIHNQPALGGGMWGRHPLALDASGDLLVAGAEFNGGMDNWNPVLLRLNPETGATLAKMQLNIGPNASFDAVAVYGSDTYILAHNNPNNGNPHVVHTLKLSAEGTLTWQHFFAPSIFWGTRGGIVVTDFGVYSAAGGRLAAHSHTGGVLWEQDIVMPNGGSALAADGVGNIYLATMNGVAKFNSDGTQVGNINITGQVSALDLDSAGNIYVVGSTVGGRGSDILTQKYNLAGALVWSDVHGKNGPYSDQGIGLSVRDGYVYVGGSKFNKSLDMCTLKYTAGN